MPRIRYAKASCWLLACSSVEVPRAAVVGLRLLALRGRRVGEHVVGAVEDVVDRLRVDRVEDLPDRADRCRDPLRLVDDRVAEHVGRLVGRDRREPVVHLRRRDHRRPHQRHVDRRDADLVVDDLRGDAAREGVEGRLRRDVGGESRHVGLHADRADVDDLAGAALAHRRQEPQDQPHGAEVVELHRPLEVVEAVVGQRDRAPDRAAGVVDQDVDVAVLFEHLGGHPVDVVDVGEVAAVDVGDPPAVGDLITGLLELLRGPGDQQDDAAGVGDLQRGCLADPRGGAGDQHDLAADLLLQRRVALQPATEAHHLVGDLRLEDLSEPADDAGATAGRSDQRPVAVEVGVEMPGPVVPELAGVGLERRHLDPGARQCGLGAPRVEMGRVVQVEQHRARDAEVSEDAIGEPVGERDVREPHRQEGLQRLGRRGGCAHRRLGRMSGAGEDVDDLAGAERIGIGEAECPPVEIVEVGDVVHRLDDEVDRERC